MGLPLTSFDELIPLWLSVNTPYWSCIDQQDGRAPPAAAAACALDLRTRQERVPAALLLQPVRRRARAWSSRSQQTQVGWHVRMMMMLMMFMMMKRRRTRRRREGGNKAVDIRPSSQQASIFSYSQHMYTQHVGYFIVKEWTGSVRRFLVWISAWLQRWAELRKGCWCQCDTCDPPHQCTAAPQTVCPQFIFKSQWVCKLMSTCFSYCSVISLLDDTQWASVALHWPPRTHQVPSAVFARTPQCHPNPKPR